MPFVLTAQGCTCQSLPADICLTPAPPVPTPYVNIFMCNMIKNNTLTSKVTIANAKVVTTKSKTSLSNGDELGVNKGVVSGKNMGEGAFLKGSLAVKFENLVPVLQMAQSSHNANNTVGTCMVVTQTKVSIDK